MKFLTIFFIIINALSILGFSNIYINIRNKVYEGVKEKDSEACTKANSDECKSFMIIVYIKFILIILEIIYVLLSLQYIENKTIGLIYIAYCILVVVVGAIKNKIKHIDKEAYVKPLGFKYKIVKSIDTLIFLSYLVYVFYNLFIIK